MKYFIKKVPLMSIIHTAFGAAHNRDNGRTWGIINFKFVKTVAAAVQLCCRKPFLNSKSPASYAKLYYITKF